MTTLTPPSYYFDPEIFEQEKKRVFQNTWQFVGFTSDVSKDNDWIATNIGGISVVIQNFAGELKALHNVCSHRFAQIRQETKGNGPLRCPYHGWIYGADGCPSAVPSRPRFQDMDEKRLRSLALRQFQIEKCGKFVFVKITEGGPDLRTYLGGIFARLEKFCEGIGTLIDFSDFAYAGNWKLVLEITLESYHVNFVHPTTLGPSPTQFNIFLEGIHSIYEDPFLDISARPKESFVRKLAREARDAIVRRLFKKQKRKLTSYWHHHIFPNFNVTSSGKAYSIQVTVPVSPTESRFQTYFFSCALENASKIEQDLVDAGVRTYLPTLHQILSEDSLPVALCQKGVAQTSQTGMLSDEELRVEHFQKAYLNYLEPSSEIPPRA